MATAPVPAKVLTGAKIEAVLGAVALVFLPFVAALALAAPLSGAAAAVGIVISSASATAIQLWFRSQASRSHFRRRQTSSRIATFAEAFSSITWAATFAMVASGTLFAFVPGAIAVAILAGTRALSPAGRPRAGWCYST